MKKSVVLPYERYQRLLQNSDNKIVSSEEPSTEIVDVITPEKFDTPPEKLNPDIIVTCLPKNNRSKALRLLDYINEQPLLNWNRAGNLVVDGKVIENSHIVDLLHDALNPTKHNPVGHELFYTHLDKAPQSLISNPRRKSLKGGNPLPPPGIPVTKPKELNVWKSKWQPL